MGSAGYLNTYVKTLIIEYITLFIVSCIANALSAFSGGGAGLLQFPILLFLGLPFGIALATHKVATVALGVGSSFRYIREGLLQIRFALFILCTGIPGVLIGANTILHIDDSIAKLSLGLLTLFLGIYSIFRQQFGQEYIPRHRSLSGYAIGGLILFFIGFLNGSLTSGTGLFVTLWLIRWFGLDYRGAVAYTMVLVGFFWNGAGAITLIIIGEVKWEWLVPLLLGSIIGGYLGANLAIEKGSAYIKKGFEAVTILVGLSLILQSTYKHFY